MKKLGVKLGVFSMISLTVLTSFIGCSQAKENSGKTVKLSFQIWDINQKEGMEQIAAVYKEKHPNVNIEVQTVNWDEYWTKLEAAANSKNLPDIFWMHSNEFMKYASAGQLADLTDLYDDVDKDYYMNNFPTGLVGNATCDGKIYGVPKDWDTIALAYNKDLFDKAGIAYPDEAWDWDTLIDAAQKIYDKTGAYGFLAPLDDQAGYLNTVAQSGGYILSEDKKTAGFTDEGTKKGIQFWIDLQTKYNFSPNQSQFAENSAESIFVSDQGSMMFLGSWMVRGWLDNYPELNWDLAILPKCKDPIVGNGRGTIYNGLFYATAANNKNPEVVKDFIKFLGSEEAMIIQGKSGAAIPAYNGTAKYWVEGLQDKLNVNVYEEMMDYGVQYYNSKSKSLWNTTIEDTLLQVYIGERNLEDALNFLQEEVSEFLANE